MKYLWFGSGLQEIKIGIGTSSGSCSSGRAARSAPGFYADPQCQSRTQSPNALLCQLYMPPLRHRRPPPQISPRNHGN